MHIAGDTPCGRTRSTLRTLIGFYPLASGFRSSNNCGTGSSARPIRHAVARDCGGHRARARLKPSSQVRTSAKGIVDHGANTNGSGTLERGRRRMLARGRGNRDEGGLEIADVHLCCPLCVKGVGAALKDVKGVTGVCDQKAKTVTITADDDATAQKGIEALAAAGYHGRLETKAVHFPRDSGATKGKVSSLTLTGIHNCCGACNKAIKAAVKKVTGVTGDTAKPRRRRHLFEVTGDYEKRSS